jgi:all-trans-retinol dehydrogenase (NAD+)
VQQIAEQVKAEIGDPTIVVNNAGIVTGKKFLECPDTLMEKTMAVNTHALLWVDQSSYIYLNVFVRR